MDPLVPPPSGYTTGTVKYSPEFSATVRRRIQQHRLSRQELPTEESLKAVRRLRRQSQLAVADRAVPPAAMMVSFPPGRQVDSPPLRP